MLKVFLYRGYCALNNDTVNHMFLIHLKNNFSLKIEKILEKNGIYLNKNFFPNDVKNSINPSAIRIGLSAITTRKMKNKEVELLANIICDIIENNNIFYKEIIKFICKKFPIYK